MDEKENRKTEKTREKDNEKIGMKPDRKGEEKDKNGKEEKEEEGDKERILKKINLRKKQNIQIMWAIFLMVSLILIIILVPYVKKNFIDKFNYSNLDFQKTKLGEIVFYSTRIPLTDKQGQIIGNYAINLRNNPKKLDYIDVNISDDIITFKKDHEVYITLNPEMEKCEDNTIAFISFGGFLKGFGGLNVSSAVTDKQYAEDNKLIYKTCKDSYNNTIIYINSGNKTEIKKTGDDCYELTYTNCEITQVTEKFMMIILEKYMGYFVRK